MVGVTKTYGSLVAVDDVSVRVAPGEVYGILGPNGAGKTTLLRMLFGLIRPDSGKIHVFGRTWAEARRAHPRRRRRLHREPEVLPLPDRPAEPRGAAAPRRLRPRRTDSTRCSTSSTCTGREDDKVGGYSYGMRQRLGVAASLLRSPAPAGAGRARQRPRPGRHPRHAGAGQAARRQRPDGAALLAPHGRGRGDLRQRHDHEPAARWPSTAPSTTCARWHPTPATCCRTGDDRHGRSPIGRERHAGHLRRGLRRRAGWSRPAPSASSRRTSPTWCAPRCRCWPSRRRVRRWRRSSSCSPTPAPDDVARLRRAGGRSDDDHDHRIARPVRARRPTAAEAGLGAAIRWEVRKLRAQLRRKAILIGAVLAPIAVVVVVGAQSRPPKDTLFGRFSTDNGFAMALLVLGFASQWLLPLVTAIVAGDVFASEDQHGTWKTVLTRSVSRSRLFWAKVAGLARVRAARPGACSPRRPSATSILLVGSPAADRTVRSADRAGLGARPWWRRAGPRWSHRSWPSPASPSCSRSGRATRPSASPGRSCSAMVMQLVGGLGGIEAIRPLAAHHAVRGLARPARLSPGSPARSSPGASPVVVWSVASLVAAFLVLRHRDITGGCTMRRFVISLIAAIAVVLAVGGAVVAGSGGGSCVTRARLERSLPTDVREPLRHPGDAARAPGRHARVAPRHRHVRQGRRGRVRRGRRQQLELPGQLDRSRTTRCRPRATASSSSSVHSNGCYTAGGPEQARRLRDPHRHRRAAW